jgi:hypothetical protein
MPYVCTPESEAHPRDLSEERLNDIEQYEFEHLHQGEGLRLNGRLVLAMIREIRRHRGLNPPTIGDRPPKTAWDHILGS